MAAQLLQSSSSRWRKNGTRSPGKKRGRPSMAVCNLPSVGFFLEGVVNTLFFFLPHIFKCPPQNSLSLLSDSRA